MAKKGKENMANETFKAIILHEPANGVTPHLKKLNVAEMPDNEVEIHVHYSSLNYKDALILSGKGGAINSFPHVPGIDLVGEVVRSSASSHAVGDRVIATGQFVGEHYWGGLAERARLPANVLHPLPAGLASRDAMTFGTAGVTATLSLLEIEEEGRSPTDGDILVTGAGGGVGSLAVAVLSAEGWSVTALEKREESEWLRGLGAKEVLKYADFENLANTPLGEARWAAAIDTVGGPVLAAVLRTSSYGSPIAACGMVAGFDVPMTLHPFFARAIRLIGIDSVTCSERRRAQVWERMAEVASRCNLEYLCEEITLSEVPSRYQNFLDSGVRGRVIVNMDGR